MGGSGASRADREHIRIERQGQKLLPDPLLQEWRGAKKLRPAGGRQGATALFARMAPGGEEPALKGL